ncbi:PREDICTED: A-kinase anchor protein 12 [Gekko japonicus]|uniref:A-kinase anchor protein 12 n=1 Tax=Gekko japonicus TaxID=146911 RepID=A0ABM1L6Q8_GEKJA|nr:PREDICTED: A-kinase anchor protein 12 [Gekko japonicus]
MGAGSSVEARSPQDPATAAGESQPSSPEAETPTAALAEPEQLEEPAKLLQKNGQISSINGMAEEQLELNLKPEELNGQKTEEVVTDVGQSDTPNVILKEESAENMETKSPESDKTKVDDDPKESPDADKQLPTPEEKAEEQELPGESPSNDVGFKKVFKFVGFKFTVRKDKTEKSEPVQLLNVKADDTEVAADGAGDCKEVKMEMVQEAIQSEVSHPVEKTEQQTQTEQVKEEAYSEKIKESPVEPTEASKEAEVKSDGSKLVESPTSPLANETASPLRKFFTWAGFRKKTSFRKPKEDDQIVEREKQDQDKEMAEENAIKEELEIEKVVPDKNGPEISVEPTDETMTKVREESEEVKMRDVSTETHQEEPLTLPSEEYVKSVNKESEICLTEKIGLASKEKSETIQECLPSLEQSTLALPAKKHAAPLAKELPEEKLDKCEPISPLAMEKTEEHFEILEDKPEPKAPLATESFDEIPTEFNNDVSTIVKKEEVKTNEKEELTHEQLVETDAQLQTGQPADEQLKAKEILPVAMNEQIKQTEPSSGDVATSKPPEGITNEVELLSSQERAKIQGSPLKKLFTSSSLKKLSGKKHKVKRDDTKSGESVEQTQLSDSAESPEEQKGESSASSPEETVELSYVEKVIDVAQVTESEEGAASDMEKKRESVTPWASFKKMVTPKKRVRRLSESDKEEELEKAKSAALASTESAPCEEQEDNKENGEEQKLEKSTDEPKRKVDTSVSWEALICVGSSKKRARKLSGSDEDVGQRLAQEGQKTYESGMHKETAQDMTFTSSQESDQGQGNSSPEQAGSPSESEGVSTWESFKRLVTPRRKSKTKLEDRTEEPVTVPSSEHSASDGDSGKEESWVSFKKLMPGRRKKKSDGIPEHAPVEEVGEEITENNEEDYDVPAVVPLSEYEAAEQEKFEAQKAKEDDVTKKKILDERTEESKDALVDEQSSEGLVHAVTVTVVEGERAVTSIEERSPSWISAAVTESIEHADKDNEKQTEQISETGIGEEIAVVTKHMPEIRKDISGDTIISELELTPEAITAQEEASGVEEVTEASCAEETTEMVSAVSRLSESPDTTEVATPVQEVGGQQNLEELNKQTQEVLQEVAEKVKLSDDAQLISQKVSEIDIQSISVEKSRQEITILFPEVKLADLPLKIEDPKKISIQTNEGTEGDHSQGEVKGSGLKEVLEKTKDSCAEGKERAKESINLDSADESETEQERHEEITKEQTTEEKSEEEDFVFVTVTAGEEPEVKVGETIQKQQHISLEAVEKEKYGTIDAVEEITVNLEETAQGEVTEDGVTEVDESMKRLDEEETEFSQNLMQIVLPSLESENAETRPAQVKKALIQNYVKDTKWFIKSRNKKEPVPEVPIQSQAIDVPVRIVVNEMNALDIAKDVTIGLETKSTEKVATEAYLENKDTEAFLYNMQPETPVQKMEPDIHLQKAEIEIPVENVKPKPHLLDTETQIPVDTVETGISIRKMEVEVHQQNSEIEALIQKVVTEHHKEVDKEPSLLNVEAEVLAEKTEVIVMKFSPEMAKPEIPTEKATVLTETDAEVLAEKAGGKVHVEASAEKLDVEVGAPAEKADVKVDVDTSVAKVVEEASVEKEVTEFHAEEVEAEVVKEVEMKVPAEKVDMKNLTEDRKRESPPETIEVLTEEAKVGIPSEMVDAVVHTRTLVEAPAEQSELVQEEAAAKPAEQKENLQSLEAEVNFQSEIEDTMNSMISVEVPVCADLGDIRKVPVQREMQDVASSSQVEYLDSLGTEGPFEVKDAGLAPKTNELGDVTLVLESKCTEEIVTEIPVQKEKNIPFMESAASEVLVQSEKEDALSLKPNFAEAELTENAVENEATVDFVENELGNTELAIKSKHTEAAVTGAAARTKVEGDTLFSDSRFTERISESCQKGQVLSEKAVTVENDKSAENAELPPSGDVLYAAPMQQHPKQQEVATTDIPEMQSYEAYKSSLPVTAAAIEEQVIEESVIVTETSTETLQSFLEEPKEKAFKIVQQVTFAHSGLGAPGPDTEVMWTEKTESASEKPILPADYLIQPHVFDSIPKMKSELSQETERQIQSPERHPSLTHIEFQKDGVEPVTIESQSSKIVLKIIQNAVDKLVEKTEETVYVSSQVCENKSEIQESLHTDQQLLSENIERQEILIKEEVPRRAEADLEVVKHVSQSDEHLGTVTKLVEVGKDITEEPGLQKENGETKFESEMDCAIPKETEKVTLDGAAAGDLPKESRDIDQPKLKTVEAGQTVQMQEHFIEQQTQAKRKEDQSMGLGETHTEEDVNNQDYTSCETLQLKPELTEC